MKKEIVLTEAGQLYDQAYEKHYTNKDSFAALEIYKKVVVTYPDSKEAEYSRAQILNIVRDVVPRDVLYGAQLDMAFNYAKSNDAQQITLAETAV